MPYTANYFLEPEHNKQLIQFSIAWNFNWSDQHAVTGLGTIDDILVTNVKVLNGSNNIPLDMAGCVDTRSAYAGTTHFVTNVTLNNISIKVTVIDSDYAYLAKNAYTDNIQVTSDGNPVTGAVLLRSWSLEELQTYLSDVTVFID